MSILVTSLLVLSLSAITHGGLLHPIYGYEYPQRIARPAAYTFALPLYQRSVALNDIHQKAVDCDHHPDQEEVVQAAAYPQQFEQAQWTPIIYHPPAVPYNTVVYPGVVAQTKIQAWPQRPHVVVHAPATRLEGVPPAYGNHHQQF